jgi:hypothetical protein
MSFTSTVISQMAVLKIDGWPEGHPHLTKIDGDPFGYVTPLNPNPLLDKNRDGYASSFGQLYRRYETRAATKRREFSLNREDFYYLTSQPCYLCAAPPSHKVSKRGKKSYIYNGLDRMNCDKGYTLGNVRPCCWNHNKIKGNLSYRELYRYSLSIVLSECSKTALDIGDLRCLGLLIELFPNVQFMKTHRAALLEKIANNPNPREPWFNWLCQPVKISARPEQSRT